MIPNRNVLLHFSILGEVISISIELFMKTWLVFTNENSVTTETPVLKPKLAAFLKSRLFFTHQKEYLHRRVFRYLIFTCGVHWFLNLVVRFNLLEHLLKYRFSFSRSRVRPGCLHFQQTFQLFCVVMTTVPS